MKTKNKTIAMVEIAVVLFSVFLVALPVMAIATEQATQKVSTSEVTTASEDDYVLDIYGNANEDDTIDMGDVVYTKLAIFGKKPKTELCDAKYDERINVLDVIQTKLIILGKEKELTILDCADRVVTVKKPVERIVTLIGLYDDETLRVLRAQDKLVGISNHYVGRYNYQIYFPEISKLPIVVGSHYNPDYEAILSISPDLVFAWYPLAAEQAEKLPGVTVIGAIGYIRKLDTLVEEMRKYGYILGRKEEAEEFIDWYEGNINTIKERTEGISEEDRPRVYLESPTEYKTGGGGRSWVQNVVMAGANNIFSDLPAKSYFAVDPEAVIERNPEIIVKEMHIGGFSTKSGCGGGYGTDDITEMRKVRDEIMNRPELANVIAVKEKKVYIVNIHIFRGLNHRTSIAYMAKWFYPELFEDLDPEAIHQEFLELQHLDYDLDEHGIFAYPPIITGEGKLAGIPDRYYDSIVAQP